jgi:L-fuconolactonase
MTDLLRQALEAFGPERCMYGSDWPVMTLATDYAAWLALVCEALDSLGGRAAETVLSGTATRVYGLAHEA